MAGGYLATARGFATGRAAARPPSSARQRTCRRAGVASPNLSRSPSGPVFRLVMTARSAGLLLWASGRIAGWLCQPKLAPR